MGVNTIVISQQKLLIKKIAANNHYVSYNYRWMLLGSHKDKCCRLGGGGLCSTVRGYGFV